MSLSILITEETLPFLNWNRIGPASGASAVTLLLLASAVLHGIAVLLGLHLPLALQDFYLPGKNSGSVPGPARAARFRLPKAEQADGRRSRRKGPSPVVDPKTPPPRQGGPGPPRSTAQDEAAGNRPGGRAGGTFPAPPGPVDGAKPADRPAGPRSETSSPSYPPEARINLSKSAARSKTKYSFRPPTHYRTADGHRFFQVRPSGRAPELGASRAARGGPGGDREAVVPGRPASGPGGRRRAVRSRSMSRDRFFRLGPRSS